MQVSCWGNSLAVRLPAAVVETRNLKDSERNRHQGRRFPSRARQPRPTARRGGGNPALRTLGWNPPVLGADMLLDAIVLPVLRSETAKLLLASPRDDQRPGAERIHQGGGSQAALARDLPRRTQKKERPTVP